MISDEAYDHRRGATAIANARQRELDALRAWEKAPIQPGPEPGKTTNEHQEQP